MCASLFLAMSGTTAFAQANVTTDQPDYPPESYVAITGTGFAAGETVQLQVVNLTDTNDVAAEGDPWTVTADTNGNFTASWYVTEDEAGCTMQLTATGLTSGLVAQTTFADSITTPVGIGNNGYANGSSATGSIAISVSPAVAVNNTVIVAITLYDTISRTVTVTDSSGNSYANNANVLDSSDTRTLVFSAPVTTALTTSSTITVSFSTAAYYVNASALSVGGLVASSPADKSATSTGTSTTPSVGPTATTSQASELLIGAFGLDISSGTPSFTAGSGYTALTANLISGAWGIYPEYQIVNATGAYSATGTFSGGVQDWAAAIVTYKAIPINATNSTISASPTNLTANGTTTSTITVTAKDNNNNPIAGIAAANVVVSSTGSGNTLVQPTTATGTNGQTTATLKSTVAQTNTVSVTILGTLISNTATVTFTPGPANKLGFTTQPVTTTAGVTMSNVVVQIEDATGNAVAQSGTAITLTLSTNGTLSSGTTTQDTDATGKATFNDLVIQQAATNLTFGAAGGGLTGATSSSFSITAAAASQLQIVQEPSTNATAGTPFATQPIVAVEDQYGNTNTTYTNAIDVIQTAPGGVGPPWLNATTITQTANPTNGLAIFTGLYVTNASGYVTIAFTNLNFSFPAVSTGITVSPAAASKLVFTSAAFTNTAGVASGSITVQRQDPYGNANTADANRTVTLASTSTGTKTFTPASPLTISNGSSSASFTYTDTKVGTPTITAASTSPTTITSGTQVETITFAPASQVAFTTQPSASTVAGVAFATQPVVTIEDQFGNTVTSGSDSTVNVALTLTTGTGTLGGTTSMAAVAGVANFSGQGLNINLTGTNKVLMATATVTAGTETATTSPAFTITAAAASQLVFTSAAFTNTAGVALGSITVQRQDSFGNPNTTDTNRTVTLSSTSTGTKTFTPASPLTISNGSSSVTFTYTDTKVGTPTITAASTSPTTITSATQVETITFAPASQLAFTTQPSASTVAGVAFATQPVVTIEDQYGNTVTSGSDSTVNVALTLTTGTGTLAGTNSMAAVAGVANFSGDGLNINLVGTNKVLTATATVTAGTKTATTSPAFAITFAPASQVVFTTQPSASTVAGVAFATQPVVTIEDQFGNTVTSGSDSTTNVTLTLTTGTGTLGGTNSMAAVAGVANFSGKGLSINLAGTNKVLTATATVTAGTETATTSPAFTITPAAASKLVFTSAAFTNTAGVALGSITVQRQDAFGNPNTTDANRTVTLSSTSTGTVTFTPSSLTISNGFSTASFTYTDTKAGTPTITAASTSPTTITSATQVETVNAAAASQIVFTTQPSASTVAGVAFATQPVVTIEDQYGNTVTLGSDSTVNVALTLTTGTGTLGGTTSMAAVAGVANFSGDGLNINLVGVNKVLTATATVTAGTKTAATSPAFTITYAPASYLAITQQPSATATAGTAFGTQPVVVVLDQFGNTNTAYTTNITAAETSGGYLNATTTAPTLAPSSGLASFSGLYVTNAASGVTLTFTSDGLTPVTSSNITVSAAVAAKLAFTSTPVTNAAGVASSNITVQRQDTYGNPNTTDANRTVTLASTSTGTKTFTPASPLTISNGSSSVSFTYTDTKSGTPTITAASTSPTTITSGTQVETITFAPASQVVFTTQPLASTVAGVAFATQPVVTIEDQYGNTVTSGSDSTTNVTLTLTTGTGTLGGTTSMAAMAGVANFSGQGLNINLTGTNKVLTATATVTAGTETANTSPAFTITAAAASKLVFTSAAFTNTAGVASGSITVQRQDSFGNPNTTDANRTVTLSSTSTGTVTFTPASPLTITNGSSSATFTYTDTKVGTPTITAASTSPSTITSATQVETITFAPASQVVFTTQPSASTVAGVAFATQPVVTIEDQYGNTVTSGSDSTTNVTLTLTTGAGTLGGTNSMAAVAGVANFSGDGLNLNLVGTNKVLTATATVTAGTKTATTSPAFAITFAPASQVVFTTQPSASTVAGVAFATQPVVTIEDQFGNTVTSGSDSTTNVALTLTTGTGTLGGTNSMAAVAGVANFSGKGLSINLAGTNKVLTATATVTAGTETATTSPAFTITAAAASKLVFTSAAFTNTAGVASGSITVQRQDSFGNPNTTDANRTVTLSSTSTGTVTFTPASPLTISNGSSTATFTYTDTKVGTPTITAASTSPSTITSGTQVETITFAPASQIVFTTQPSASTVAGVAFATQPVVTIEDQYGNTVTSGADSTVNMALTLTTGTGTLGGTTSMAAVAGVASFSGDGLNINLVGTNKVLTATATVTAGTKTATTSPAFTITFAPPSQVVFTTQPSASTVAGVAFATQPVVTIEDQFGNTVTSGSDSTTNVALTLTTGTGTLGGTTSMAAVAGVANFSGKGLNINLVGTNKVLTATATVTTGTKTATTSPAFTITFAPASQVVFTTQPSASTVAGVAFATQPVVTIEDQFGNTVTLGSDSTTNVALTLTTGTGTLSGTTSMAAVAGVANFAGDGLNINLVGTNKVLTATATVTAGTKTATTSPAFTITPAASAQLAFTTQPGGGTGGTAWTTQPVVTVRDAYGNTVTTDTSSVTLAIGTNPSGGILSGTTTVAAVAGVATFSGLSINKAGTNYTLTATDGSLTNATSSAFNITTGPAAKLAYTTVPTNGTAGTPFSVTVQSQDAGGNPSDPTSSTTITLSKATGGGNLTGTLTGTIATNANSVTISTPVYSKSDTMTLTATATAGETNLTAVTSGPIVFSAGAATAVFVETAANGSGTVVPAQNIAAASSITVYAITRDANSNFVGNPSSTWSLTSITGGVVSTDLTPSSGASSTFTGHLPGSAVIHVVDSSFNANSGTLSVVPGAIASYVVSAATPQTAGWMFTTTVTAKDSLTNTVTNNSSTVVTMTGSTTNVQFDANGDGIYGDNTKTLTAGTFTINTLDNNAETITITATDANGKTGASGSVVVEPVPWDSSSWDYRLKITISHTNVYVTDQTNFPVLINMTNATIAAQAQTNGFDFVFTGSNGTSQLPYERERYVSSNGALVAWVQVPLLSHTYDTVLYLYFGNPSASDQQQATNVWDANYKGVWHLKEATGATNADSTANGNYCTPTNAPVQTNAIIDGGLRFNGTNQYLGRSVPPTTVQSNWTLQAWINPSTTNQASGMVAYNGTDGAGYGFGIGDGTGLTGNKLIGLYGSVIWLPTTYTFSSSNTWYHVVMARNSNTVSIYLNGVSQTITNGSTNTPNALTNTFTIGDETTSTLTPFRYFNGLIDEVRISNTNRSPGWIETEYTNQASPSTFYTVSSEQTDTVDHYVISAIASPQTAGTPFTITNITAQDVYNNTVTSFGSTVTFGGTAGVTGTSGSFSSGVLSNASVTPTVAGTGLTVTVTDAAGHTGSATIATVNPGAVNHFVISAISSPQTAGTPFTITTITAQDANSNTVTSYASTVTFDGTAGVTGTSGSFTSGVLNNASVTATVAGSNLTVTVTDGAGHTGSATIATVTAGAANAYIITAATTNVYPGTADALTITLVDQYGNTVISNGDKSLTFSGLTTAQNGTHPTVTDKTGAAVNLGTATTITFTSGISSAGGSLLAYTAETQTLAVQDSAGLSTTNAGGAGVSLTISNVVPFAANYSFTRASGLYLIIPVASLMASNTDANGDTLAFTGLPSSTSAQGATLSSSGSYVFYIPNSATNGDTFSYRITNGFGLSATGVVTVLVVTPGGVLQSVVYTNGTAIVSAAGIPGLQYNLLRSTDLVTWTNLATVTAPSAGVFTYTDNPAPSTNAYYELQQH